MTRWYLNTIQISGDRSEPEENFGFWRLKHVGSEFWVTLLETDYFFFQSAIEQDHYFLLKIRARNFFLEKKNQNIKCTVPNSYCLKRQQACKCVKYTFISFDTGVQ